MMETLQRYCAMGMRALQQMLTGRDNLTIDFARVGAVGALVAGVVYAGVDVVGHRHGFSFSDYGVGVGAILGGGGLAVMAKRKDEPGND